MKLIHLALAGVLALGALNGCASLGDKDKTMKGTALGAVAGAAVGAAWGAARGNWKEGAAIGAGVGALAGGITGAIMDRQEEALRKAGIQAERDEAGNLVVSLSGETLKFETGKAILNSDGEALLTKIAGILTKYPEDRITISGHTDNVGRASDNVALSQRRADSVKAYILSQGVPPRCILSSTGYGSEKPVADNASAEGKAQNRRVELSITVDKEEADKNEAEREKLK
jgi:outer membrane protein OmpA-like peptidoglycan-associated protein